jgi:hypothetical protein
MLLKKFQAFAAITAVSSSLLAFATPVRADNSEYIYQIRDQLIQGAIALGLGGYSLTHDPFVDVLTRGNSDYITLNLRAGTSYGIVGVCDDDCRDLDLVLSDSRGNRVAADLDDDDNPVISIRPSRSGTYRVRVDMTSCRTNGCYYGIGVFGK